MALILVLYTIVGFAGGWLLGFVIWNLFIKPFLKW